MQGRSMICGAVCPTSKPSGASENDAGPGEHPEAETPRVEGEKERLQWPLTHW